MASDFGISEEKLCEIMNAHITKDNLNEYIRFANLIDTTDYEKVKVIFEFQIGKAYLCSKQNEC